MIKTIFRRDNLLNVDTLQAAESVLADLSSLPVVPLLQLALEKPRGGRTGAIGAVGGGIVGKIFGKKLAKCADKKV